MKSMKSKIAVALFSIAATAPAFAQYYDSRNNPISLKEGDVLQAGVGSSDAVIKRPIQCRDCRNPWILIPVTNAPRVAVPPAPSLPNSNSVANISAGPGPASPTNANGFDPKNNDNDGYRFLLRASGNGGEVNSSPPTQQPTTFLLAQAHKPFP